MNKLKGRFLDWAEPPGPADDAHDFLQVAARDAAVAIPCDRALGGAEQFQIERFHALATTRAVAIAALENLPDFELVATIPAVNPVTHSVWLSRVG